MNGLKQTRRLIPSQVCLKAVFEKELRVLRQDDTRIAEGRTAHGTRHRSERFRNVRRTDEERHAQQPFVLLRPS